LVDLFIDPIIAEIRILYSMLQDKQSPTLVIKDLLNKHANIIYTAFKDGNKAVTFHLGSWCPDVVGKTPDQIMASDLSLVHVRESVAREYGFADWQTVLNLQNKQLDQTFETAVDSVITGNLDELQHLLNGNSALVTQHSGYGHSATLLHYLGANGVESHRQITPMNSAEVAQRLIDHGADVNASANMYGGGSTALGLVLSSAHPAKAGVTESLANVLRNAGAH